jgi:hypothetical protein
MTLSGHWEGKLVDAVGVQALIEMDLSERNGRLSGDFSTYLISEGDDCRGTTRRLAQTGEVKGTHTKRNAVRLRYEVTMGLEPVKVELSGRSTGAGNHASEAIVGCYETEGGGDLTLRGGGVVLWKYRGQ